MGMGKLKWLTDLAELKEHKIYKMHSTEPILTRLVSYHVLPQGVMNGQEEKKNPKNLNSISC